MHELSEGPRRFTQIVLGLTVLGAVAWTQTPGNIFTAILGETGQRTAEVSTEELRGILAENRAVVLDARPHLEFAISHILNFGPQRNSLEPYRLMSRRRRRHCELVQCQANVQ